MTDPFHGSDRSSILRGVTMKQIYNDLWHTMKTEIVPSLFCGKCVREGFDSFIGHYYMGALHKEDGPAVEYIEYQRTDKDGTRLVKMDSEYWLFGKQRTEEEYKTILAEMRLIKLIKQDPQLLSLAFEETIDSYQSALSSFPDDSDAKQWHNNIVHLEQIRVELDKLWRK